MATVADFKTALAAVGAPAELIAHITKKAGLIGDISALDFDEFVEADLETLEGLLEDCAFTAETQAQFDKVKQLLINAVEEGE